MNARDNLANKLAAYYEDVSNRAIVKPGIAEKSMIGMGAGKGTLGGEAIRTLLQFKTWPIAAMRQVVGTELRGRGDRSWQSRAVSLTSLAAAVTVLGSMRNATNDLINGMWPRNPLNPSSLLAGLSAGGGYGIIADVLFSQGQPDQHALANMMVGPLVSAGMDPAYFAWQKLMQETDVESKNDPHVGKALLGDLVRTTVNNVPGANLFYAKTILDYLLIWHLQEMVNPGYQRRYERRMQKQGRTFWLSPANAVR
jgi:hypothetical protein